MLDPCLGFSREEIEIPGLAEGLVFPEQEELSVHCWLFQNRRKSLYRTAGIHSSEPQFIKVLVGTKEGVEKWLKLSGPARCALWIEVAEDQMELHAPDEARKTLNGELLLAHRLRLYTAHFHSILKGIILRLSPYWKKFCHSAKRRTKVRVFSALYYSRLKSESLRQQEKERFLRSVGITHLGDDFCEKAGKPHGAVSQKKQWIRKWLVKMPADAFKQLFGMLSAGGAVFEFQQVLSRIVHIPNFLDVDFRLVDILDWLGSHRFVVLLEGLDLIVAAQGLKWAIIRFNFVEGLIRIAADESLSSLLQCFSSRKGYISQACGTTPGAEITKTDNHIKTYGTTNAGESLCDSLWEAWEPSPKEQDSLQAGFRRTGLLDGLLLEGNDSFVEFLWDEFNPIFPKLLNEVQQPVMRHPKASRSMILELKPSFFIPSVRLSSKEKCALSNLGSSDRAVRQRGIRLLLRLMRRGERNGSTKPSARRSGRLSIDKVLPSARPDKLLICLQKHLKYSGICTSSEKMLIEGANMSVGKSQQNGSVKETVTSMGQPNNSRHMRNDALEPIGIEGLCSTLSDGKLVGSASAKPQDRDRETVWSDSQPSSARFVDSAERNHPNCFEDYTFEHSSVLTYDREFSLNFETLWARLSEWVQNGFTDALIIELIMGRRMGSTKEDKWFNVNELTNTCLQVIAILPGEGCCYMVQSLKKSLENCIQEHNILGAGDFCEKGQSSTLVEHNHEINGHCGDVAGLQIQKVPRYEKIQEACLRAWRLGRILHLLLQRSSIISASLAECGGLDLILELYSCLVNNLFVNRIHLGHLSFRADAGNEHGLSLLPGEVSEKHKIPSKIFPFFNAISHLVGAQQRTPQRVVMEPCFVVDRLANGQFLGNAQGSVEEFAKRFAGRLLSWTSKWFLGRFNTHKSISNDTELCQSKSVEESTCKRCKKMPFLRCSQCLHLALRPEDTSSIYKTIVAVGEDYDKTPIIPMADGRQGMSSGSVSLESTTFSPCNEAQSKGDKLARSQRPQALKLTSDPLTRVPAFFQETGAKMKPEVDMNLSKAHSKFATDSTSSSLTLSCMSSQSSSEAFNVLCKAKYSLLKALALLLSHKSSVLSAARRHLKLKLESGVGTYYSFCLMIDLISCFQDISSSANRKIQKLIFQVVFLLDNEDMCFKHSQYHKQQKMDQLNWSSLGPPYNLLVRSFSYHLLMEIAEQLKTVLADWCQLLPDCGVDKEQNDALSGGSPIGLQCYGRYDSFFLCKATYHWRGICSSLWAYLNILIRILTVYIDSSPKAAAGILFKSCGEYIESVFHLLATSDASDMWGDSQRQALQSLLRLFEVSLQDCFQGRNPVLSGWNDFEELFWQMTVKNKVHWEFMKNCLKWAVFKSCHGCMRSLVGTSFNGIVESAGVQYDVLEKTEKLASPRQGTDMLKSSLKWISSVIMLIQRKIDAQNAFPQDDLCLFSPVQMLDLLDFLMNPVDGLVMKTFKDPFSCAKVIQRQTSRGQPFIQENCTSHADMPTHQRQTSGQTPVSFALDLGRKNMSGSISSASEIEQPQHRHQRMASSSKNEPIYEAVIYSGSKNSTDALSVDHGFCHQQQCLHVYAPEELPQKLCRSCTQMTSAQLLYDEISLFIQQEIANLSAQVFNVRFCGGSRQDYIQAVKQRLAVENPFLSSAYVDPFLEYHFLGFSQVYDRGTQHLGQTKDQAELNSADCESSNTDAINTNCKDVAFTSMLNSEDQKVIAICLSHVAVLLALAQNQTEAVSRKFKQLKVMDFLLQQIALEYESSHVVTPRGLLSESRNQEDFDATNVVKVTNEERGHLTMSFLENKQDCAEDQMVGNIFSLSQSNVSGLSSVSGQFAHSIPAQCQALQQIEEYPADHELKEGVTLKMAMTTFTNQEKDCLPLTTDSSVKDQSILNACNHGEMHSVTKLSCVSRKELDTQLYVRNHDNEIENISEFVINEEGEFLQETFNSEDIPIRTSLTDEHGCMHYKADQYSDGSCSKYRDVFIYTGRFFDLNEEVERELAEEEILHGLAEGNEASVTVAMKESDGEEVSEDSFADDSAAVRSQSQLEDESEALCSGKEGSETFVFRSFDEGEFNVLHPGKKQPVRTVVPKLNLPKSARKGDQESVTSNDSIDRELLKMPADPGHRKKLSMQGLCSRATPEELVTVSIFQENMSGMAYEAERYKRLIYHHNGFHLSLLELFVSLMLTPQGTLEACYSDRFPTEGQKLNAPFFLSFHLNHGANAYLLPLLTKKMKDYQLSAYRILKLTCRDLFNPSIYTNRLRIAHGAFAQVYTATVREDGTNSKEKLVVLKTVDLPKGPHDPCKFFDVYSEVEILEKFSGEPRVCQLLDYGVDLESFVLVLKHYKCSLKAWRHRHNTFYNVSVSTESKVVQPFSGRLTLYLEVYAAVLQAVKALEAHNVVHYDIKCDNILLDPVEVLTSEEDFWDPLWPPLDMATSLPFKVCIADFGQSKASILQGGECTVRNRGTEYVKSPEMLKLLGVGKGLNPDLKAQNLDETVGRAVDIWGLGCLLYELLTGEYLMYDEDWIRFFIRVTLPSEELITNEKAAKVDHYEPIMDFLHFVLVRDPLKRPTLDDLISHLAQLQSKLKDECLYNNEIHRDRGKNLDPTLPQHNEIIGSKLIPVVDGEQISSNIQISEMCNCLEAPNHQNICNTLGATTNYASDHLTRNFMARDSSLSPHNHEGAGDGILPIDLRYTDQSPAFTRFLMDCLCFGCEC